MKLEELKLVSFKGFSEFRVPLTQFTCLVGPNNGGKTSILHGVQLLFDILRFAFGNRTQPDFANIQWQSNPTQVLQRLTFGDPEAIWLRKRTSEQCRIEATLSEGVSIALLIKGPNSYVLDITREGKSISTSPADPEHRPIIEAIWKLQPEYVPPVGAVAPAESFLLRPQLEQELNKGRATACWRSQLFWLWNDGDKDAFGHIVSRVRRYLPNASVLPPRLSHTHPAEVLIEFVEDGTTFDISTSGGGLRTLLNLAVVLEFSSSRCLLLDEPDSHLHATLQRAVGQMLADYAQEEDVQLVVASHAPDLISEVPVESLVWIDRTRSEAGITNSLASILSDLGALSKADAIRAHGADKVLFVEGSLDRGLLSSFFDMSGTQNPFRDPTVIVAPLPGGKGVAVHLDMFRRLLQETFRLKTEVACILDADYELQPSDSLSDAGVLKRVLRRKEIENYLISAELLTRASKELVEKRRERTGEELKAPTIEEWQAKIDEIVNQREIRDTVRFQVIPQYQATLDPKVDGSTALERSERWFEAQWRDPEYRLRRCPGKRVLAELRRWCQSTYKISLTVGALRRAILTCPPDIKEIVADVEKHFCSP